MSKDFMIINAKLPKKVVMEFRQTIFTQTGLVKGDFRKALIEALKEYVDKRRK